MLAINFSLILTWICVLDYGANVNAIFMMRSKGYHFNYPFMCDVYMLLSGMEVE